jgi:hypothetical protein
MESRGILIIFLKMRIPRFPTKPPWNPYYFIKNQLYSSKQHGFAEVAGIGGYSAADFAQEFGVGDEGLVLFGVADLIADIVQEAEVFVVA